MKKKSVWIWLAIGIILLLLAGSVLFIWKMSVNMFEGNPRFTLAEVRINGNKNGFWTNKKEQICSMLQLHPKQNNLFSLNLGALKAKLTRSPPLKALRSAASFRIRLQLISWNGFRSL